MKPEHVDAVIADWESPWLLADLQKQQIEEAKAALAEFAYPGTWVEQVKIAADEIRAWSGREFKTQQHLDITQSDLAENRKRHRKLLSAIKHVLGLEHWPEIEGDFLDGVIKLLKEYCGH